MTDEHAEPKSSTSAQATANEPPSAEQSQLRNRSSRQPVSQQSDSQSQARRRSSILSFGSLDDARSSFHEDIIQPSSARRKTDSRDHEITHWSSTPLAFAILPAVCGLVFKNGSAFATDALLLTLAAVFMNWSIRVPREWYHSAQAIRRDVEPDDDFGGSHTEDSAVIEEEDEDIASTPPTQDDRGGLGNSAREKAAAQLRTQELLALLACFLFPVASAYLLHVIRSQLSRPSESLVSDYNLSIFVIAAEFWPARQVIRLVAARTLHLQRIASGFDNLSPEPRLNGSPDSVGLLARIEALETKLGAPSAPEPTVQLPDLAGLDAKIQKRLEPRLDSLERAVRRYEKRYTTLTMVTEQRFQNLETRMQDALSLAAVAAQHSQGSSGILRSVFAASVEIATLPAKLAWEVVTWPAKVVDEIIDRFKVLMLGPRGSSRRDEKRKIPRTELRIKDDKVVREKPSRKLVR